MFDANTTSHLLDEGSWILARNLQVRDNTQRRADEARQLLLTYRLHRLCTLKGGSEADVDGAGALRSPRAGATNVGLRHG